MNEYLWRVVQCQQEKVSWSDAGPEPQPLLKRWGGLFVLFCWNLSQTQKYWLVRYWRPTANFVG